MRRLMCSAFVASLVLFSVTWQNAIQAQTKRGITPEDYLSFQFISDPHLSPDGKVVAYVVTTINQKKNRRESAVWSLAIESPEPARRLSAEGFSSSMPRWSPDGKTLAIVSARNLDPSTADKPKAQIYLLPVRSGGEATALTNLKNGVEGYQWSPDGTRIVLVSATAPNDGIAAADRKSDVRHYTHIIYKSNDSGWDEGKRQHLWVVDVAGGEARQITNGQEWTDTDPQWSPDSTRIAFVSDRTGKAYDDSHNTDVWVIPAIGGPLTKISDHAFEDESPRWSADGRQILFTGQTSQHQFPKVYVANSSGGGASQLAVRDLDTIPAELIWPLPGSFFFAGGVKGETQFFRADPAARTFSAVASGPRGLHALDINAGAGK